MLLTDFFDRHYLPHKPGLSVKSIRLYHNTFRKFGLYLEEPPRIKHLKDRRVGGFMAHLILLGNSPPTVNKEFANLRALWVYGNAKGKIKRGPTVQRVAEASNIPKALTLPQIKRLWATFPKLQGKTGGIPNADFLRACFAIQYATAARVGSVMQLRFDDISGDVITFRAETRKGGRKPIVKAVPASVIGYINAIRLPKRELIFPVAKTNKTKIQKLYERLFARAGVPRPKGKSSHLLRSTHATLLEIAGGDATKSLGHANRETTINSYLDPRHEADRSCDLLPDLEG